MHVNIIRVGEEVSLDASISVRVCELKLKKSV